MSERFDRFAEDTKLSLQRGHEEAVRFNHNFIGTEHILIGLLRGVNEEPTVVTLNNFGLNVSKARSAVGFVIGRGERKVTGDIGFTPRAKRVIELSIEESRRALAQEITPTHLLQAIIRDEKSTAVAIIESFDIKLEELADRIGFQRDWISSSNQQRKPLVGLSDTAEFIQMLEENNDQTRQTRLVEDGERLAKLDPKDRRLVDSLVEMLLYPNITRENKDFVTDIVSKLVVHAQKAK